MAMQIDDFCAKFTTKETEVWMVLDEVLVFERLAVLSSEYIKAISTQKVEW